MGQPDVPGVHDVRDRRIAMAEWRDVKGYEGLYEVSDDGRVRSYWHKKPRILKHGITDNGYCLVVLVDKDHIKHSLRIHQIMAEAFIPNPFNKPGINHIDGNKQNNVLSNLERCTYSENLKHAYAIGLRKPTKGRKHNGKEIG